MAKTTTLRGQHDELVRIVTKISPLLTSNKIQENAKIIRDLLSDLFGKLNVHLVIEDKSLYPGLIKNPDDNVKKVAQKFIEEMGSIGEAVKAYKQEWPTASHIQKNPNDFLEQTKGLFDALANRIERENNELYKLVDEL